MNKNRVEELKNSINMCKIKLKTILPHLSEDKPALNEKFNKLLIEKAVLKDKLHSKKQPFFVRLAQKISPKIKKELICDYFNRNPV